MPYKYIHQKAYIHSGSAFVYPVPQYVLIDRVYIRGSSDIHIHIPGIVTGKQIGRAHV